ncbi:transcription elongation factor GreA [Candidatus Saccharibacteria bacterium]|jgi:transcription elongation factor GreA|nr:transcription elongation factor GreA [Candidatus Saccharibacteria bacterium]MBP9131738.1 transcription elongation factor GreA [Candidatus Saccharibacteria bacterium]
MQKTIQITKEGKAELEAEKDLLISQRGEVANRLSVARSFGDLSENAEFDSAKREQQDLEKRVQEIDYILKNSDVIKNQKRTSVGVGSMVTLIADGKTASYHLVGSIEANPAERKISDQSPIGQALLDKKEGEEVTINLPAGAKKYKVKKIE